MSERKLRKYADKCFEYNMVKYSFSFSPSGIYNAAFDNGILRRNWRERMKSCRPSMVEHPLLYRSLKINSRKALNAHPDLSYLGSPKVTAEVNSPTSAVTERI